MLWNYTGDMAVHVDDSWDIETVSGMFELPDANVKLIRDFLYSKRDFILAYKHNPPSGDAPWGDNASQSEMRSALAQQLSDDEWGKGVDRQTKAYLVAFYHQVVDNIDLYCPVEVAA